MNQALFHEKIRILWSEGNFSDRLVSAYTQWLAKEDAWGLYRINPVKAAADLATLKTKNTQGPSYTREKYFLGKEMNTMKEKTALITGATSGISRATALGLARLGAQVVIVARDKSKAEATVQEIMKSTGSREVHYLLVDLASQESIRTLASEYKKRFSKLDILINNAGGALHERKTTPEGYEYTFAFNHLAYFLLTNLLLEEVKKSPEGRIINVSSEAQAQGKISLTEPNQNNRKYSSFYAYSQSKLANIVFSKKLARRLKGSPVTVNALHPGIVRTNFGADSPMIKIMSKVLGFIFISPEKGAEISVYLASSPEVYLWDLSTEMTGLNRN